VFLILFRGSAKAERVAILWVVRTAPMLATFRGSAKAERVAIYTRGNSPVYREVSRLRESGEGCV
jgi:hypothetical protein